MLGQIRSGTAFYFVGDDIKTVQENLGHATASFTLSTYAHTTQGMKQESAHRMEKFLQGLQEQMR